MLVLTRKMKEAIVVGGNITITVMRIKGNTVQLGIEAPPEVPVHRAEVQRRIFEEQIPLPHVSAN